MDKSAKRTDLAVQARKVITEKYPSVKPYDLREDLKELIFSFFLYHQGAEREFIDTVFYHYRLLDDFLKTEATAVSIYDLEGWADLSDIRESLKTMMDAHFLHSVEEDPRVDTAQLYKDTYSVLDGMLKVVINEMKGEE
ncbi:MAG: hypothetical protein ACOYXB_00540 [Bacteroidota bacterium]